MRKESNRTRVSDKVRERRIRTCLYGLPFFNVRRYSLTHTMDLYHYNTKKTPFEMQ